MIKSFRWGSWRLASASATLLPYLDVQWMDSSQSFFFRFSMAQTRGRELGEVCGLFNPAWFRLLPSRCWYRTLSRGNARELIVVIVSCPSETSRSYILHIMCDCVEYTVVSCFPELPGEWKKALADVGPRNCLHTDLAVTQLYNICKVVSSVRLQIEQKGWDPIDRLQHSDRIKTFESNNVVYCFISENVVQFSHIPITRGVDEV
ncbi:hypothetical protein V6N11_081203 [Hibiscus sabdariffa]|uniref:Uncharacterized protein n=1 Tax=Hibiscus sabdariffa TaxID=183260 RepID=A0ABR2QJ40_9ROSI